MNIRGITILSTLAVAILLITANQSCRNNARANESSDFLTEIKEADTPNPLHDVSIPADLSQQLLEYPGFTVSFNRQTHQPNYVVWELTRDEVETDSNVKRSNNFQPDTTVVGSATLDDYRNSNYDRGHMAPSGDLKWSKEANEASFLLTNISPQAKELNGGAWRVLEESCRRWACRDSAIWIVCGPIFDTDSIDTIGQSQVAVPTSYFKVVLSPYTNPPSGIGFIMPNSKVDGGVQPTAVTIDEVERVTGYDFFFALPDDIEDQVESECNFPRWNRRHHKR